MTFQSGGHETVRQAFLDNGKLPNSQDSNYRSINDDFPVFGFGKISHCKYTIYGWLLSKLMKWASSPAEL